METSLATDPTLVMVKAFGPVVNPTVSPGNASVEEENDSGSGVVDAEPDP
jgi:hypothetical protein